MGMQLARAACDDLRIPPPREQKAEQTSLRMSWVVVTDECGNRQLRMRWRANRDLKTPVHAV